MKRRELTKAHPGLLRTVEGIPFMDSDRTRGRMDYVRRFETPHIHLVGDEDHCPCGSSLLIRDCCSRGQGLFKKASVTSCSPPNTGYSNPKCYAASLKDCCEKLTEEHWLSKSTLELIEDAGGLYIQGLGWQQPGRKQKLHPESINSRVLCERHNKVLSPIDVAGTDMFRYLLSINQVEGGTIPPQNVAKAFLVNGHDVERWFLKILIGGLVSANMPFEGETVRTWSPPQTWLKYLFGLESYLKDAGLYYLNPLTNYEGAGAHIAAGPVGRNGQPSGLIMNLVNFHFAFVDGPRDNELLLDGAFRPKEIVIPVLSEWRWLAMSWEYPGDAKAVVLERAGWQG